ncbi:MAG: YraN family protein [Candidatus Zixiibacteriota bacterium]
MKNRVSQGRAAEEKAAKYLQGLDYKILERNFTVRGGEIDIIAEKDNVICFIEVKYQSSKNQFAGPFEKINSKKRKRIIHTAKEYVFRNQIKNHFLRFDAIAIIGDVISHIEDAFRT